MTVQLEYKPEGLTYDRFLKLEQSCFPDGPLNASGFAAALAGEFWLAIDGGEQVGYASVARKPRVAWLSRIGVAPQWRGMGVANQLMEGVIDYCQMQALDGVMLYVQQDNPRAIRFYEKWGFEISGESFHYSFQMAEFFEGNVVKGITAVPLPDIPATQHPIFPIEWEDLPAQHQPPARYTFALRTTQDQGVGYARLVPDFPGCFPFAVAAEQLQATLWALRPYLNLEQPVLKLTFTDPALAAACDRLGFTCHYRLHEMTRSLYYDR